MRPNLKISATNDQIFQNTYLTPSFPYGGSFSSWSWVETTGLKKSSTTRIGWEIKGIFMVGKRPLGVGWKDTSDLGNRIAHKKLWLKQILVSAWVVELGEEERIISKLLSTVLTKLYMQDCKKIALVEIVHFSMYQNSYTFKDEFI